MPGEEPGSNRTTYRRIDMEEIYEIAFGIIGYAGDSRSLSIEAVKAAEVGDYETAAEKLRKAVEELNNAHAIQTDMLQKEAAGDKVELSLLMVHAQDHFAMALMQKDFAEQMITMYKRIGGQ